MEDSTSEVSFGFNALVEEAVVGAIGWFELPIVEAEGISDDACEFMVPVSAGSCNVVGSFSSDRVDSAGLTLDEPVNSDTFLQEMLSSTEITMMDMGVRFFMF